MNPLLESALQLAGRGHFIVPLIPSQKRPIIATGKGHAAASRDPQQIEVWWAQYPNADVGIIAGRSGLCVVDVDGPAGAKLLQDLIRTHVSIPNTLAVTSGRPDGGVHFYFRAPADRAIRSNADSGLDLRAGNNIVVAPPSRHKSGAVYRWVDTLVPIQDMPLWLLDFFATRRGTKRVGQRVRIGNPKNVSDSFLFGSVPAHLQGAQSKLHATLPQEPMSLEDAAACVVAIENPDLGWDDWNTLLMTLWVASVGASWGLELAHRLSAKSKKYDPAAVEARWRHYADSPPTEVGAGSLVFYAREAVKGFELPSRRPIAASATEIDGPLALPLQAPMRSEPQANGSYYPLPAALTQVTEDNPLIKLNERYAAIGDVGGKCLVLSWVPSKVDESVKVPSFQSFKSFAERYGNQYVKIADEPKQLGGYWLKWTGRRSYEGLDLVPGPMGTGGEVPAGVLNLWTGFAVEPKAGSWARMQEHIFSNLACQDAKAADYIFKFAAWCVQHPGERAEVALVFKGGKGSGKSTFGDALVKLFGAHGLHIHNSKHLVGTFNGHLRNCLLLFADEAFWAGDKQGESTLKGLLTDRLLTIEQKGVDAVPWRNRLHVVMAANADWVVPASHDERRYAMFDVSPGRIGDRDYWAALHNEMRDGGLAAMLHDLQRVRLGGWHPREIIHNEALQQQKERSLDPRWDWWQEMLQAGTMPRDAQSLTSANAVLNMAQAATPKLRDLSATALGRFLRNLGGVRIHRETGNFWKLPELFEARKWWEKRFGMWNWDNDLREWNQRNAPSPL